MITITNILEVEKIYTAHGYCPTTATDLQNLSDHLDWQEIQVTQAVLVKARYLSCVDQADIHVKLGDSLWINSWNRVEAHGRDGKFVMVCET